MFFLGLIAGAGALAYGVWMARFAPRLWRGTGSRPSQEIAFSMFSEKYSLGLDRAVLPMATFGFSAGITVLMSTVMPDWDQRGDFVTVLVTVSTLGMMGSIGLAFLIVWFNRPLFLVPPPMRQERGTLVTWWAKRFH